VFLSSKVSIGLPELDGPGSSPIAILDFAKDVAFLQLKRHLHWSTSATELREFDACACLGGQTIPELHRGQRVLAEEPLGPGEKSVKI